VCLCFAEGWYRDIGSRDVSAALNTSRASCGLGAAGASRASYTLLALSFSLGALVQMVHVVLLVQLP
jgi:hypothetical protein